MPDDKKITHEAVFYREMETGENNTNAWWRGAGQMHTSPHQGDVRKTATGNLVFRGLREMQLNARGCIYLLGGSAVQIGKGELLRGVLVQDPKRLPADGIVLCSKAVAVAKYESGGGSRRNHGHRCPRGWCRPVLHPFHRLFPAKVGNFIGKALNFHGELCFGAIIVFNYGRLLLWRVVVVIVRIVEPGDVTDRGKRRKERATEERAAKKRAAETEKE